MPTKKEGLSGKERHFCEQYIISYNQTQAAIAAGYPEKSAAKRGSELMKRPEVRAYVKQLQDERSERLCVGQDFVMKEALDLLQKCTAAIPVMEWDYNDHKMMPSGEYQVDSKGACRCLELINKMIGEGATVAGDGVVYLQDDIEVDENG